MSVRISYLRDSTRRPLVSENGPRECPLNIVVPYTGQALTTRALHVAVRFAQGFDAAVTLVAVHVLPYPARLESNEGIRQHLEAEMQVIARTTSIPIDVKLIFARSREEAFLDALCRESLVVMGTQDRWWRTREERFARELAAAGHSVAIVKVK